MSWVKFYPVKLRQYKLLIAWLIGDTQGERVVQLPHWPVMGGLEWALLRLDSVEAQRLDILEARRWYSDSAVADFHKLLVWDCFVVMGRALRYDKDLFDNHEEVELLRKHLWRLNISMVEFSCLSSAYTLPIYLLSFNIYLFIWYMGMWKITTERA